MEPVNTRAGRIASAELHITIAALGFFYFNIHTLSTIFERNLNSASVRRRHLKRALNLVLRSLRP